MTNAQVDSILLFLNLNRGFDFSGYHYSMLQHRILHRMELLGYANSDTYLEYLQNSTSEADSLIDVLTINVSSFFRNPFDFEYLQKAMLPQLIHDKTRGHSQSIRIWSAGCANGEEPYSVAILMNELLEAEGILESELSIFASDLDKNALERAQSAVYHPDSLQNVKLGLVEKYFTKVKGQFHLDEKIKKMVHFSFYDLMDKQRQFPPESIFGGFDLVLCRNVLIYFKLDYQKIIFHKLHKSLNNGGMLILGQAEMPVSGFTNKFSLLCDHCKIYKKNIY